MKLNEQRQESALPADRPGHKEDMTMQDTAQETSMGLKLALAWGFVGIPLAWGVIETIINATKLFH
jgi:hypothetical protein